MSLIVIYTTYPDKDSAERIAHMLLSERLVACANTYAIGSSYWWQGAIVQSKEWVAIFKSIDEKLPAITSLIETHHPHEVPCIVSWAAEANPAYLNWVNNETKFESEDN